MNDSDKQGFKNMLDTVMALYGKPSPDKDQIKVWWFKLNKYEFNIVTKAFNNYVDKYKIMPTPAGIIDLCKINPVRDYVHQLAHKSDPEVYERNRAKFHQIVSEFKNKKRPHPKAWAQKIIDNPGNCPEIAIRFAKEALHVE